MKVIVLGCGIVGSAMAKDLADSGYAVTVTDASTAAFQRVGDHPQIVTQQADLADPVRVSALIAPFDVVIGAVPGFMGFRTLETILRTRKNVVDISFFPENALELDALAKEMGVSAVVDCGVAPGLSNMAFGHMTRYFDETRQLVCYVGGLPVVREKPFEYKFCFSPHDVLEEYIRPARIVEGGRTIIKEALSDLEEIFFDSVGTLESFNSDGLRTLVHTLQVPDMLEKTLRYPGHVAIMKLLREAGFFSKTPVEVEGKPVTPMEFTVRALMPKLKFQPGEADFTIMRISGMGRKDGQNRQVTYDLLDRYDSVKQVSSMARTTGYTCTAVARQMLQGKVTRKGIVCPEYLGMEPGFLDAVLADLQQRGVTVTRRDGVLA